MAMLRCRRVGTVALAPKSLRRLLLSHNLVQVLPTNPLRPGYNVMVSKCRWVCTVVQAPRSLYRPPLQLLSSSHRHHLVQTLLKYTLPSRRDASILVPVPRSLRRPLLSHHHHPAQVLLKSLRQGYNVMMLGRCHRAVPADTTALALRNRHRRSLSHPSSH